MTAPPLDRPLRTRLAERLTTPALAVWIACWLLHAGPSPGQSPDSRQPETRDGVAATDIFEVIDVEVVNIDVWVTDRNGDPVEGLDKEDFRVLRDGRPIEITNFYAVSGGRPANQGSLTETAPGQPLDVAPPEIVARELAPEHRLWLVVYIDNYNLDPIERERVLPALREFLGRTVKPRDRAMVVTFDRGLEVVAPFTHSVGELFAALEDVEGTTGHEALRRRQQFETLQRIDRARDPSAALGWARQYAEEQLDNVRRSTDALERLIESLAGLPGRKALVHVSSGIPLLAGEEMFHAVGEKFGVSEAFAEIPRHAANRDFERLNRQANAHRVSFYPLDAGGLRGMHFAGAEYAGFVSPRLRITLDSIVPENLQSSLRFMAEETGGRAIVNRNETLPALEEAAQDFRTFYSLGITSAGGDPGGFHEIEVKLANPDRRLDVRHRGGYRSKDLDTRVRETLRSALLYSHQSNPLGVEVTWGRAERAESGRDYILPIGLRIPMRDVVLLPIGGNRHEARLRLFVAAAGHDGELSSVEDAPLGLRVADEHVEAAQGEALVHSHRLRIGAGRRKVGVAILDVLGREASVVTGYLDIGPATGSN